MTLYLSFRKEVLNCFGFRNAVRSRHSTAAGNENQNETQPRIANRAHGSRGLEHLAQQHRLERTNGQIESVLSRLPFYDLIRA
jgi:hypothetical protein